MCISNPLNPLRHPPEEYSLRESIKHRGLVEPLIVCKNKDGNSYSLIGGGHNRLRLINSINQELKPGAKPILADCVVREPLNEIQTIISVLIQKELSAQSTFIERALMVQRCIELLNESSQKTLKDIVAIRWLVTNGFPISKSLYSDMKFTLKVLLPAIPIALYAGLGRQFIVEIRLLHQKMAQIWKKCAPPTDSFDQAFRDMCEEIDTEEWDMEGFQLVVEDEIALGCNLKIEDVRRMMSPIVDFNVELKNLVKPKHKLKPKPATPQPKVTKPKAETPDFNTQITLERFLANSSSPYARRRTSIRSVVEDLASASGITTCLLSTFDNAIGYEVVKPPPADSGQRGCVIHEMLLYMQQQVEMTATSSRHVDMGWDVLEVEDVERLSTLILLVRDYLQEKDDDDPIVELAEAA